MFDLLGRLTVVLTCIWAFPLLAQSPSTQMLSSARSDVGFVVATNCTDGQDRSGTAFVWPTSKQVITARHVVAGCNTINIVFKNHGTFSAGPIREIRAQDLIALELDSPTGATVQTLTDAFPPLHSQVAVVGFALGAPTADDKLLTVTTGNQPPPAKLRDLLPSAERNTVAQNGPWELDTAILRLDGNLTHGHSGAPVFDHQGRVVAIGAGGLKSGATGIVWAVNASYLLDQSNWSSVSAGQAVNPETNLSFSVQSPQSTINTVNCGNFSLSLSRKSTFYEIAATVDDPLGLQQLQNAVGFGLPLNFNELVFEVWEDLVSGAVIPLPQGSDLRPSSSGCTATVGNGVAIWIRSYDASGDANFQFSIQNFSLQLESDLGFAIGPNVFDPNFTYSYPLSRPDGFMANRKGVAGPTVPVDHANMYQNYGFVSHIGRGPHYFGVAALRRSSFINTPLLAQCQATGNSTACSQALPPLYDWAVATLSVHMSTMPPI
ncbi:S1 family peptidase [Roseobacter litoralis]|uniref:Trypsin-like peptidase domain-containing protein n=1 Tax=Roseobacter litoralis (strain ATCC 49566 / DSM 6996 / JCM 21268 / NBRC 15278 / OCh 149) TaxID=391595 RepID=F7ZCV5_ROSLO|nr:serine protease [Roseobacter litoralis]AEI95716.1 hypothetical protein RLO149_c038050 [Roseobacter litoralis Och 149]